MAFLKFEHVKISGMAGGVPVILGKHGVDCVIELEHDADDNERFDLSQKEVRQTLDLLKTIG